MASSKQRLIMTILKRCRLDRRRQAMACVPEASSIPRRCLVEIMRPAFLVPLHRLLQIPMRLPFALATLDWITPRDVQGARIALDLDGQRGWTCPASGGYCVATALALPQTQQAQRTPSLTTALGGDTSVAPDTELSRWLTRLSLVLAGQPALRDDSLCIANDVLWWVHRFDGSESAARVEAQLRRQLLACAMVTSQGLRTQSASLASPSALESFTSQAGGAAHASRHLHSLRRC